jgi:hypothetical protein
LHSFVAFVLQPVQYRRLASVIESQNEDPNLLGTKETFKEAAEQNAHSLSLPLFKTEALLKTAL